MQISDTLPRALVVGCGALAHDLKRLFAQNNHINQQIDWQCLPAKLHNTPQFIAPELDKLLAKKHQYYNQIFIAYGDCGTGGALDAVLERYGATRLAGAHCYEFFAGSSHFQKMIDEEIGSFFLTDYLVRHFDRLVMEGLGLDKYPELFNVYFEHYKKLVYLAQTDDAMLREKAEQIADDFGFVFEYHFVGIDGLKPITDALVHHPSIPSVTTHKNEHVST